MKKTIKFILSLIVLGPIKLLGTIAIIMMILCDKDIPIRDRLFASFQWVFVSSVLGVAIVAGILMALVAALTSKKMHNAFGEIEQAHDLKYINQGSSQIWEYWASPIPFVRLWSNYEDGDLGEPSGKQSVRVKGKERSLWNRYVWLAIRNPFNMGKRTIPMFHCMIDECDVSWWGDKHVSDKTKDLTGWQFVKAVHRKTGKVYYGYYSVRYLGSNKVSVVKLGFKIKPSHGEEEQDADDKDKAFTMRWQPRSEIN